MATYYSQGNAPWSTLANWDTVAGGGGSDPASANEAGMDNHTYVIQAGHTVTLDLDMTAWTNGIAGLTIESHATTPGMLTFKADADGTYCLSVKTGTTIQGTNAATFGRILANSDNVWANSGALAFGRKAIINLKGTANITADYLDIKLLDTEPANLSVECYATKYTCTEASTDVNATTDLITFAEATPPAAGTAVMVRSAGTLPGGLTAADVYYVRSITDLGATFTCKLCLQNDDATAVNLTSAGSGALYAYTGVAASGTLNTITDVSADPQWVADASVVLVDANAPESYDQQRTHFHSATASTVTLHDAVDSTQYPLARVWLMTRNVAIRSNTTASTNLVSYPSAATHGGIFQCEIRGTAGTGTTFYGTGVYYGTGHTVSGTVSGCSTGVYSGTGHTVSGTVSGCSTGVYSGTGHTVSGTVSGCSYTARFGDTAALTTIVRGTTNWTMPPTFSNRSATYGANPRQGLYCEDYGGVLGASRAFLVNGDVIRNDTVVRVGGASFSMEVIPQSHCAAMCPIPIAEWTEMGVAASSQTRTIYVKGGESGETWSPMPTDVQLWVEAEYYSSAVTLARATVHTYDAGIETVLPDNSTWTAFALTFEPGRVGVVRYRVWLATYQASAKIYVDAQLGRTGDTAIPAICLDGQSQLDPVEGTSSGGGFPVLGGSVVR